jgi:hypothetical protein
VSAPVYDAKRSYTVDLLAIRFATFIHAMSGQDTNGFVQTWPSPPLPKQIFGPNSAGNTAVVLSTFRQISPTTAKCYALFTWIHWNRSVLSREIQVRSIIANVLNCRCPQDPGEPWDNIGEQDFPNSINLTDCRMGPGLLCFI